MKAILVSSGDDYAALQFEDAHGGTKVQDIIDNPQNFADPEAEEDEEPNWTIEVFEVGEVSKEFLEFVRFHIQDYDDSKSTNFWMEDETV